MDDLFASRLPYAVSADTGTDYYLCASFSSSATNNQIVAFQYQLGEWTIFDQIDANCMAEVYDVNGDEQIYFGGYGGVVCEVDDDSLDSDVYGFQGTISGGTGAKK